MKHEINIKKPKYVKDQWNGHYDEFNWLEEVVNIQTAIFIITTLKENNVPNANLHSWGYLVGDSEKYVSILTIANHTHTYKNIINKREWCLNFPTIEHNQKAFRTIENNKKDINEITEAGFLIEKSDTINTPRINECPLNIECKLIEERPLLKNSRWHLFIGEVVHVAIDDSIISINPEERNNSFNIMYHLHSILNPLNGDFYYSNKVGIINELIERDR